jgi:hypothetical protein
VRPEVFFVAISTTTASGRLKLLVLAITSHAIKAAQVWSKSACNDGHFTLVAETIFRPYLDYLYIGQLKRQTRNSLPTKKTEVSLVEFGQ